MKKAIDLLLSIALCLCSFAGCVKTETTQTAHAPTAAAATELYLRRYCAIVSS